MAFKTQATASAEESGFELYDYSVLAILGEGARVTQATIADALSLDPSRLVALLDSLEARGLVARQRDPQDRRRHVVNITDAGTAELARLRVIVRALEDEFFAPLDGDERETLHPMLGRARSAERSALLPPRRRRRVARAPGSVAGRGSRLTSREHDRGAQEHGPAVPLAGGPGRRFESPYGARVKRPLRPDGRPRRGRSAQ